MHRRLDILSKTGFAALRDYDGPAIDSAEWESLQYLDWKSGGDTNFAPLASATGDMDCRGFWDHGKADKDDPRTETRIPLHPGAQLVVDTERLWHVAWHPGPRPRYALITSWEASHVVDGWIRALQGKPTYVIPRVPEQAHPKAFPVVFDGGC